MVIRSNGDIALCDFGFAKHVGGSTDGRAWTFCGSPDFMAPELVIGQAYDSAVDWWSFGALVYNLLVYFAPFDFDPDLILSANAGTRVKPDMSKSSSFFLFFFGCVYV